MLLAFGNLILVSMVTVAQPVEHWSVEPVVTGSIPVGHPDYKKIPVNSGDF